jgi:predicted nucleic acid-binding protein
MGTSTLLDSNVLIYLTKGGLDRHTEQAIRAATTSRFNISVISQIELLGFAFPTSDVKIKTERLINQCTIFPLNDQVVAKTIELRQQYRVKLPDAIIAATAIVFGLTLLSRNDKDFSTINELSYFNPF